MDKFIKYNKYLNKIHLKVNLVLLNVQYDKQK